MKTGNETEDQPGLEDPQRHTQSTCVLGPNSKAKQQKVLEQPEPNSWIPVPSLRPRTARATSTQRLEPL